MILLAGGIYGFPEDIRRLWVIGGRTRFGVTVIKPSVKMKLTDGEAFSWHFDTVEEAVDFAREVYQRLFGAEDPDPDPAEEFPDDKPTDNVVTLKGRAA